MNKSKCMTISEKLYSVPMLSPPSADVGIGREWCASKCAGVCGRRGGGGEGGSRRKGEET